MTHTTNTLSLATEEDIQSFEKIYELKLPKDYKDFLIEYDKTNLKKNIKIKDTTYKIIYFCSLLETNEPCSTNHLIEKYKEKLMYTYDKEDDYYHYSSDIIPIAILEDSNMLCLNYDLKDNEGRRILPRQNPKIGIINIDKSKAYLPDVKDVAVTFIELLDMITN